MEGNPHLLFSLTVLFLCEFLTLLILVEVQNELKLTELGAPFSWSSTSLQDVKKLAFSQLSSFGSSAKTLRQKGAHPVILKVDFSHFIPFLCYFLHTYISSLVLSFDLVSLDFPERVSEWGGPPIVVGTCWSPSHSLWAAPHGLWGKEPQTVGVPGASSCLIPPAGSWASIWQALEATQDQSCHSLKHSIMAWKMMLQQAVNTDYGLCKFFILQFVWPLQEIRLRFIFIIILLLITEYTCRKYCSPYCYREFHLFWFIFPEEDSRF